MRDENEKRKSQYPVRREYDDSLQAANHQSRLPAQIGSKLFLAAPIAWQFAKFGATHSARITWNLAKLIRDICNSDFVYEHERQLLAAAAILGVYVALIVILAVSGLSFVQIALFLIVLTFLAGCAVAAKMQEAKDFMKGRNRRRSSSEWRGHQRNRRRIPWNSEEWWILYNQAEGECRYREDSRYCEHDLFQDGSNSEVDHEHPFSREGSNDISNLQLICKPCNKRKGDMTHDEFMEYLESDYEEEDDGIFRWR